MNSTVGSIFNEKVVKKKVCGSHEQCTGPTKQCHSNANLVVNEVVGPMHSARDPLAGMCSRASQLKKKKKKKRGVKR